MTNFWDPQDVAALLNEQLGGSFVTAPPSFATTKRGLSFFSMDCCDTSLAELARPFFQECAFPSGVTFHTDPHDFGLAARSIRIHIPQDKASDFCAAFTKNLETVQAKMTSKHDLHEILLTAIKNQDLSKINWLLAFAGDSIVNRQNSDGMNAGFQAINFPVIMERLLSVPGMNVNAINDSGYTMLMRAADRGHLETVDLLLAHPAINLGIKAPSGKTALEIAKQAILYQNSTQKEKERCAQIIENIQKATRPKGGNIFSFLQPRLRRS